MKFKFHLLFIIFTFLFLFYPGDSYYFHIFAYNRPIFDKPPKKYNLDIKEIPFLKDPNLQPDLSAEGIYMVDLPSFTPIYIKNHQQGFYPASTTKIITALVAYDIYKPDQIITVKRTIADGQIMNLAIGERITVENLLYGLLVYSANDAAFVLADNYGLDKFVRLMNDKAKKLHMGNSRFKNPSGLDDPQQYTTPFDLALAARELMDNKYLSRIVGIKEITIADADYKYFHQLTNVNKLLGEIQGLGGLKTGHTEGAGDNLVSFYKKDGHEYILVILKSQDRFADTREAINWLNGNVDYYSVKYSLATAGT
ncbi:D-alanyl-D-alanine carboxypeptidase [Candidatus Roizmanbacteria bacterium]|jgi:D-alanyl-D-alanine carboxypeptidase (penicillin-binding protein 5/6)|nr:D-alanyl-D-alanine carboxypeptidase [Candidatus Roizmanbacteria bacterium]